MIRELTADCVHCGFCLPTCPTYVLWREEMDSPRGRIHLMDARLDGTVTLNATVTDHFDRCLGCMACVSSCPSGVRYDRLIETTRAAVEREYHRPLGERLLRGLLFRILPYPGRMRAALRLASIGQSVPLPRRFRPLVEVAPPWRGRGEVATITPAEGTQRGRVGLLTGCVQSAIFPDVNAATAHVLAADGFQVVAPPQGCCGALSVHAGRLEEGKAFARSLIGAFDSVDLVVVNASGCGSHLKELGWLLGDERAAAFSAKVRDVGELLADVRPRARRHPLALRVALQDSCHLRHAQGLPLASLPSLGRIPGLEVVEPAEQELCCGSAGIYNLVQPEAARELGDRKAGNVLATGAGAYASANPGCLVQVSQGLRRAKRPLPAFHPIELVDASIRNVAAARLAAAARR
jgi:glycolate oxidase iron-sulfur subunit